MDKQAVRDFWNEQSCGESLYLSGADRDGYIQQAETRYQLEPYILEFGQFDQYRGKRVLEIGVGLGADHQMFAAAGAELYGIDLTERAVAHTSNRLGLFDLPSNLQVSDAEELPFEDESFDLVYSWGVLHHTPRTDQAVEEVHRVLKKGGEAKVMIYHKHSIVGWMLWLRYGLLGLKPLTPLSEIYSSYLESPGTKAYTVREARKLFGEFEVVRIETVLSHGDLLTSGAGQRHQGMLLNLAKRWWPRRIIRSLFAKNGLFMMITATK